MDDQKFTQGWNTEEVRRRIVEQSGDIPDAPTRKRRKTKKKQFNWKVYVAAVVLGSMLLAGIGWILANDLCALDKGEETATVTIAEGDGVFKVASKLKKAGLIQLKGFFILYEIFTGAKKEIDPGTYELNTTMDYRSLVNNMYDPDAARRAEEGLVLVTIPEGYTVAQIIDLLAENGVSTKEELEDAAANFDFGEDYSFIDTKLNGNINRLEGYLFPDTYEFSTKKTAVFAIDTMLTNFVNRVDESLLNEVAASKYNLREIITIASIIEKEARGDYEERANVSSVLHNRLENEDAETAGFLQVDAAINYALAQEGLDNSHFSRDWDSPYNTYKYQGLPVGPICNPGLASIRAAIEPSDTNYYYYALGKDGVSHFFRTYNEHVNFLNSSDYQAVQ